MFRIVSAVHNENTALAAVLFHRMLSDDQTSYPFDEESYANELDAFMERESFHERDRTPALVFDFYSRFESTTTDADGDANTAETGCALGTRPLGLFDWYDPYYDVALTVFLAMEAIINGRFDDAWRGVMTDMKTRSLLSIVQRQRNILWAVLDACDMEVARWLCENGIVTADAFSLLCEFRSNHVDTIVGRYQERANHGA
jgi:hypothetical protein